MAVTADKVEAQQNEDRASIALQVPTELKTLVDSAAEAANVSTAAFVRGMLADRFSFVIPADFGTRSKYGSDEERKAATKAKAAKRNALLKMLMSKYRAGEIDLNDLLNDDDDEE